MFLKVTPAGMPRPRMRSVNGYAQVYPSTKQQKLMKELGIALMEAYDGEQIRDGVKLKIVAQFPIPKAVAKKDRPRLDGCYKVTKPDYDNVEKLFCDTATKVGIWKDDALVASCHTEKRWVDDPVGGWTIEIDTIPLGSVRA